MCARPNTQQKPGEVPTPAHMGPSSTCISYTTLQAFQPPSAPPPPKPPPTGFHTSPSSLGHITGPPSCCPFRWGHIFSHLVYALGLIPLKTPPNTPKSPKTTPPTVRFLFFIC